MILWLTFTVVPAPLCVNTWAGLYILTSSGDAHTSICTPLRCRQQQRRVHWHQLLCRGDMPHYGMPCAHHVSHRALCGGRSSCQRDPLR